jgi:hypothetical protein
MFKSYLTDQKQFVEINQRGHINSKQHIFPHFLISYINDLPLNIEDGQLVLFADDINLLPISRPIRHTGP